MAQLEARKELLEAELAQGEDAKVVPHPNMAHIYREQVADLRTRSAMKTVGPRRHNGK
jgi:hypothetical protein